MHVQRSEGEEVAVDDAMTVVRYLPATASSKVSLVRAMLHGQHSLRVNRDCDQIYYILSGTGSAVIGDVISNCSDGDVLFIPAGVTHEIHGDLELLIVNGPAYDPEQTDIVQ